jgi:hypothetical protein
MNPARSCSTFRIGWPKKIADAHGGTGTGFDKHERVPVVLEARA